MQVPVWDTTREFFSSSPAVIVPTTTEARIDFRVQSLDAANFTLPAMARAVDLCAAHAEGFFTTATPLELLTASERAKASPGKAYPGSSAVPRMGGSFEVFCMDGAEDEQQRRVPGQLRPEVSVDFQTKFSSFRNFGVVLSFAVSF